jgi:hypothetical protein
VRQRSGERRGGSGCDGARMKSAGTGRDDAQAKAAAGSPGRDGASGCGVGLQGRSIRAVEVGSWRDNDSEKAAETQGAAVKAEKGSRRVGALARLDVRPRHESSNRGGAGRGLTDWGTAHESRPRRSVALRWRLRRAARRSRATRARVITVLE